MARRIPFVVIPVSVLNFANALHLQKHQSNYLFLLINLGVKTWNLHCIELL